MRAMRLPGNERQRVARLRGLEILDSQPESGFDEIVSIAADICQAPIALISLLDEHRQWFKARVGFERPFTARSSAFCSETILSEQMLIVEDARKDSRFATNEFVTADPSIVFYAGAPLITNDGFALGSLCIMDYKPRTLSGAQQAAMRALARQAVLQMELRQQLLKVKTTIDVLGETERRFRLIADASPILMWISDQAGNRTFFNAAWCDFTGLSQEDSLGESWKDTLHPDDRESYDKEWKNASAKSGRFQQEFRLRHASGTYRWVLEQSIPLFSSSGRLEAYVSSCVDLSSRIEEELSTHSNEARFRAISEAAPLGIFVTDSSGNFIYTNHQFQRISGQSIGESLGSGWLRAVAEEDRERVSQNWQSAMRSTVPFEETHRYKRPDGSISWCSVKAATINSTDTVSGWVGTVEDITQLKIANAEILAAKQAAESAMHAKSQFLANMSHEIRTPLTAIIGFAESLREDLSGEPDRLHTLEIILNNGQHLLDIINEILDLSKIDAGALTIEKRSFGLVQLVEEVRTMFAPRIAEKALSFSVQYKWPLPGHITTDPLRVKQVLINLLSNAIKFTSRGWIELKVEYDKSAGQIFFTVTDSGIGISEDQSRLLFRPFFQANESITRQYGGSGLGLSISRRLANALGGDISVVSTPGRGSSFKFWLSPSIEADDSLINEVPSEQVASPLASPPKTFSGKVLFADDALDNRRLVNHLLEKAGVSPTLVEDGQQAVDAALKDNFDLILLDVQMPHVDGLSAARAIRQAGIKTPIVALSAGAMTSDILKAIDAGCSMHLSKPFSKEGFSGMLERFLPIATLPAPQDSSSATPILTNKDLLDDDTLPLVIEFVGKLPEKLSELEATANSRDSAKLASLAHRLRGSAGLYGYPELSELCGKLEKLAKTNPNEPTAPLVSEIATVVQRIIAGCPASKNPPHSDPAPLR